MNLHMSQFSLLSNSFLSLNFKCFSHLRALKHRHSPFFRINVRTTANVLWRISATGIFRVTNTYLLPIIPYLCSHFIVKLPLLPLSRISTPLQCVSSNVCFKTLDQSTRFSFKTTYFSLRLISYQEADGGVRVQLHALLTFVQLRDVFVSFTLGRKPKISDRNSESTFPLHLHRSVYLCVATVAFVSQLRMSAMLFFTNCRKLKNGVLWCPPTS
jgi:hypothetical protein